MDSDAALAGRCRRHSEGTGSIVALEHDITCLRRDLRHLADDVFLPVAAGVDGHLADAGCAIDDMSRLTHTVELHALSLDDHLAHTGYQVAGLIDIADDHFRG